MYENRNAESFDQASCSSGIAAVLHSGWLVSIDLAMFCSMTVLPTRGGATIRAALALAERGDDVDHPARSGP